MNEQQIDYCKALSTGAIQTWDKGCTVMLTCDEWIQLEQDENRWVNSSEAAVREDRAVDITDEVIIRMMGK